MDSLERISKLAVELDWHVAFGGRSAGNRHLERVAKIAGHLLELIGSREADSFVVLSGAWLHDVGLIVGNLGHAATGKKISSAILRCMDVVEATRERIEHCVEAHDRGVEGGGVEATSLEAKIVHDADTLDKIGPLGVLRHSWKISLGMPLERLLVHLQVHLDQRRQNLYLDESRELAFPYDGTLRDFFKVKKDALRVLEIIGKCAQEGVPSEEVVSHLEGMAHPEFMKTLRGQLALDVLRI
jgi:HD superfamily phosphodiesterase